MKMFLFLMLFSSFAQADVQIGTKLENVRDLTLPKKHVSEQTSIKDNLCSIQIVNSENEERVIPAGTAFEVYSAERGAYRSENKKAKASTRFLFRLEGDEGRDTPYGKRYSIIVQIDCSAPKALFESTAVKKLVKDEEALAVFGFRVR